MGSYLYQVLFQKIVLIAFLVFQIRRSRRREEGLYKLQLSIRRYSNYFYSQEYKYETGILCKILFSKAFRSFDNFDTFKSFEQGDLTDIFLGDPDKRDQEDEEDVEAEDYLANLKAQQQAKRPQQQQQQSFRN